MKSFEELECWKAARELRKEVSKLTKTFPEEEKYKLKDQMLRCSRSVTNNIAEGFGRFYAKDNIRFCRNSKGSLYELTDHFIVAFDENYITEQELKINREAVENCLRILNGYINYLNRQQSGLK
ncbi:MAG TPA: four helix bundle protein [Flavobacteriales bacterium]|nr:four helix bundle protein [Flavobacteriales bacterium]